MKKKEEKKKKEIVIDSEEKILYIEVDENLDLHDGFTPEEEEEIRRIEKEIEEELDLEEMFREIEKEIEEEHHKKEDE